MSRTPLVDDNLPVYEDLPLAELAPGKIHRFAIHLMTDALGNRTSIPVIVARGAADGPVFGVTAAVHGNEVNGIPIIQRLFRQLKPTKMQGTVVGVPVVAVPAFEAGERTFGEGFDLNRIMPGRPDGNEGQVYAHRFLHRLVVHLDYLIDLHTASFGRINSLYVRADLRDPTSRTMARLQRPEIIVHNEAKDGTLRDAAMERNIPAITVEVGNPLRFQSRLIKRSRVGLLAILKHFGVIEKPEEHIDAEPVICGRSYWIYAQHGGLISVLREPTQHVEAGQEIARVHNVFGDLVATYCAPVAGVVVGRATNPICRTGSRILHLGVTGEAVPALSTTSSDDPGSR